VGWRGCVGGEGGFYAVSCSVEETGHDESRVPSCDAPPGPPISWVPLVVLPPDPSSPIDTAHIPLERGGARCGLQSVVGIEMGR